MLEAGPSSISERERWKEMNKKDFEPNQRYVERRKYKRGAHLQDPIGYFPGGDFYMELDLSNRTFIIEHKEERIIIDDEIPKFRYSPIVTMGKDTL